VFFINSAYWTKIDSITEPQWQDIVRLADEVRAFDNRIDVAYLAENSLLDERGFIERDMQNTNVRLTGPGRENCARGIDIPRSDIQKIRSMCASINENIPTAIR
jgi:hypothetical protein